MDYQEILDFAYGLAEKLVTETDQAVEEMIKTAVADRYPSHKLPPLTDEYTWIVDPIDAGAVIVHEVGGLFSGGKDTLDSPMAEILMGRRYIFIRALPSTQRRLVRTLYDVVDEWTNEDM
ncbi:hypothetical protein IAR55_005001 [Kwoniella newhampshirensis]|uniref:Uncharacterized protein n=1 Tax=Kwoniella newhampshirensis TaxID=1651941 RepID=A0AAW0YMG0_9TREE